MRQSVTTLGIELQLQLKKILFFKKKIIIFQNKEKDFLVDFFVHIPCETPMEDDLKKNNKKNIYGTVLLI